MAGELTNAGEAALLKDLVNEADNTLKATHVGLLTAISDAEAGSVTECADSGYARLPVTWTAVTSSATENEGDLTFGAAVEGFTVVGLGLYSASTAGTLLAVKSVTSQAVAIGNQYQIPDGNLDLSMD